MGREHSLSLARDKLREIQLRPSRERRSDQSWFEMLSGIGTFNPDLAFTNPRTLLACSSPDSFIRVR